MSSADQPTPAADGAVRRGVAAVRRSAPHDGRADDDTHVHLLGAYRGDDTDAGDPVADAAGGQPATASRGTPWLIALAVFAVYAAISVAQYARLGSVSWDLGIFTEAIARYAHLHAPTVDLRQPGLDILGDHVDPIIILVAPFFRLFPTPVTLLVAQTVLIAGSVVPVTRLAVRRLGAGAGYAVGIAYGFSWGLQNAIVFDFHEVAFAVPMLALSLTALVDGRHIRALLWSLPLLLVMEDQGFTVLVIGLVVAASARPSPRVRLTGLAVAAVGLGASLFCILWVVPHFNPSGQSPYWQIVGVQAPGAGHSPLATAAHLLHQGFQHLSSKLPTLFLLLLPTAFVALRSPLALVAVPAIALRAVSAYPGYWGTMYHYNATVMPILFVAAIDAIVRIRAAPAERTTPMGRALARHAPIAMLAIAIPLANQFGLARLWTPHTTFAIPARVAAADRAMAVVPDGAHVEATLDLLAPLATRTDTFWIGNINPVPDYVVWDNQNSGWSPAPTNPLLFIEQRHGNTAYRQIYADSDGFLVFERVGPKR